ncbi:hypothetical protein BJ944DRAFT_257406 [Cunninghamella echinulata]|nr:hypothetical protein BJ944DRAFT_257406 [Cunninghamella echinulata]
MTSPPPQPSDPTMKRKRKKVSLACVFCRRSHMTCDEGRPCQRCIKRSIGDLCHDEPRSNHGRKKSNKIKPSVPSPATSSSSSPPPSTPSTSSNVPSTSITSLNTVNNQFIQNHHHQETNPWGTNTSIPLTFASESMGNELNVLNDFIDDVSKKEYNKKELSKENFFLTAADPKDGKLEDRLNEVINAKYEAGFLKPYNYVNGYARLQRYMDKQDYDRVFSAMAIPACLWRRTGEIYKGNKEFATLIDVSVDELRDGRMCIYEIMAEESTVNYWEKYGNIAFDPRQKAVLTSCLIRHQTKPMVMSCCFSFTVRRDKYNIPTIIVGNFLPIEIQS